MREVLPDLAWWEAGRPSGWARSSRRGARRRDPPSASMLVGPGGEAVRSVSGVRRRRGLCPRRSVVASGHPDPATVWRVRRDRRVGRPDLRQDPRRLCRAGQPGALPRTRRRRRRYRRGPSVAVATVVAHPDPATKRPAPRHSRGRAPEPSAALAPTPRWSTTRPWPNSRAVLRHPQLWPGRRTAGRAAGVRRDIRPPADDRLQGHRLRRRRRRGRSFLGYAVTVCDARPVFATASRFPAAGEVVVKWPHRYLAGRPTRAPRRADGRLRPDPTRSSTSRSWRSRSACPRSRVGGDGVAAPPTRDRLARLREAGLTDTELARLSSPIGLDLGAHTPQRPLSHRRRDHRPPGGVAAVSDSAASPWADPSRTPGR